MLSFLFGEDEPEIPTAAAPDAPASGAANKVSDLKENGAADMSSFAHSVFVCGFASGKAKLNGEYRMTGQWVKRRPVYSSVEKDAGMAIWYADGWCLGPKERLGTNIAMAHNGYKGMKVWLTTEAWKVQFGGQVRDEENVKVVPMVSACVIGADGSNAALNGCYELQRDLIKLPKSVRDKFQDKPVYKKTSGAGGPHCIWCCDQGWCVGLENDVGTKMCYAASDDSPAVPWLVASPWKMVRNGGAGAEGQQGQASTAKPYWTETSNLHVVPYAEAYLSGCGVSDGAWNGLYIMREDWASLPYFSRKTFRGRPVFQHKEGKQQCIWFTELGWCVGLEKDLGTTKCGIYNKSKASVPWLCSEPWQVLSNKQFAAMESLRIAPVCTEATTKERDARMAKAAKALEAKQEAKQGAQGSAGEGKAGAGGAGALSSSAAAAAAEKMQQLEKSVAELQARAGTLESEAKRLCERFVDASVGVGLTQEIAKAKLSEAEKIAQETPEAREPKAKGLPPLLQQLVEKLVALKINAAEATSAKAELEKLKLTAPKMTTTTTASAPAGGATEAEEKKSKGGAMGDLPEPMVKGLSDEIQAQIAEAERKLEDGPDLLDSLNPLPVLRDIPLFGDLVSLVAPAPKEEPLHAFEPGRFE
uniref:Uncharacterized protein n=1 Tax=Lotharella globosa TaxID=91324 RepID=A0A6V3LXY4_9EUKA|mmetsp:Transcript_15879/g.30029  ORF Transcript_15879/g.30029 Transcript_15879/m.30029 type:complete len:644 (+) Transcript_15879:140-2071(+)